MTRRRKRNKTSKRKLFLSLASAAILVAIAIFFFRNSGESSVKKEKKLFVIEDSITHQARMVDSLFAKPFVPAKKTNADGTPVKHRILGVGDLDKTFPDQNDVQLATATKLGISPMNVRKEAEGKMDSLVKITSNENYHVTYLTHSIPYLVPRAQRLVERIGMAFNDSLAVKGMRPCKIIVTSVLRTKEDIVKLQKDNKNAVTKSCHQCATTFDITYNNFFVTNDSGDPGMIGDPRLCDVLAEVLRDLRELGTCYVKYEKKQTCFHITAR